MASHGEDIAAATAPYAIEPVGDATVHGAPAYTIVMQDGAIAADGKDVIAIAAPIGIGAI